MTINRIHSSAVPPVTPAEPVQDRPADPQPMPAAEVVAEAGQKPDGEEPKQVSLLADMAAWENEGIRPKFEPKADVVDELLGRKGPK